MTITIYHNPKCGTSRKVLTALREAGREPVVIEYLKTPPSRGELKRLFKLMGLRPADGVRRKEKAFADLKLATADDDALLDAMAAHPILIERPIVVTDKKARICRPPEIVKEFL
jgi:arsenate reductase (glutaredoxin)